MTLRTAVSTRKWENTGELSTHYWIEVEPELWLEVDDVGTPEAAKMWATLNLGNVEYEILRLTKLEAKR